MEHTRQGKKMGNSRRKRERDKQKCNYVDKITNKTIFPLHT